jgi:putative Mn2+ efflux pump MntP
MNFKKYIAEFIRIFAISLLVTLGVTFLGNLFSRGTAKVDWETSFRFAILFAIILPIAGSRKIRG